ncbi:MAG TPA: HEAT repeat domain-containing protein, partial [Planctomycetaceae bacterium]|nr:HEAT repeat domain-containing protein [Planctomycetaceae bacterium]
MAVKSGPILPPLPPTLWQEAQATVLKRSFPRSGQYDAAAHADALVKLIEVARFRDVKPAGDLAKALQHLIQHPHPRLQASALTLAGTWNVKKTAATVLDAARNDELPVSVRAAALEAMVEMKLPASRELLVAYSANLNPAALRSAAIESLAAVDTQAAARQAAQLFAESDLKSLDPATTLAAFLNRSGGAQALAAALEARNLKPASARQLLAALFTTGHSDK